MQVAVVSKGEPKEVQRLPGRLYSDDACLLTIDREPQVSFERLLDPAPHARAHPPCQHHEVVCISHQFRLGELSGPIGAVER